MKHLDNYLTSLLFDKAYDVVCIAFGATKFIILREI